MSPYWLNGLHDLALYEANFKEKCDLLESHDGVLAKQGMNMNLVSKLVWNLRYMMMLEVLLARQKAPVEKSLMLSAVIDLLQCAGK